MSHVSLLLPSSGGNWTYLLPRGSLLGVGERGLLEGNDGLEVGDGEGAGVGVEVLGMSSLVCRSLVSLVLGDDHELALRLWLWLWL